MTNSSVLLSKIIWLLLISDSWATRLNVKRNFFVETSDLVQQQCFYSSSFNAMPSQSFFLHLTDRQKWETLSDKMLTFPLVSKNTRKIIYVTDRSWNRLHALFLKPTCSSSCLYAHRHNYASSVTLHYSSLNVILNQPSLLLIPTSHFSAKENSVWTVLMILRSYNKTIETLFQH